MYAMGSTWRRLRIYYINNVRLPRVLSVIGVITILYLLGKFLFPSSQSVDYSKYSEGEEEIKEVIDSLQDTRPILCRNKGFEFTRLDLPETVSILTEFHGKQFVDLQLTLSSIVEHTPYDLYNEIIIIDDGTDDQQVRQNAAKFLQHPKFNKAKLYRSESRDGQAATRYKASQLARGSILVYVSSTTMVNHGWIQPLLTHIAQEPRVIVIPHSDNILSGHRFARTDDSLVSLFTWSLNTVYTETDLNSQTTDGLLDSPVMRGDVLAVKKSFLGEIGNFDEHFRPSLSVDGASDMGAGHHLELSIRAWLCGNGIKVATCSRVATHNTLRPHHVTDGVNFHRIAELWLEGYKRVVYRQGKIPSTLSEDESQLLTIRRSHLRQLNLQGTTCKDMRWYLENVAKNLKAPTSRAVHFGKLKSKNNQCLRIQNNAAGGASSWTIDMAACRPHIYELDMMLELNSVGQVVAVQGSSLTTRGVLESFCLVPDGRTEGELRLEHCVEGEESQRWMMIAGRLRYRSLDGDKCLTDVTEPDSITSDLIHVARLVDCEEGGINDDMNNRQTWEFIHF